MPLPSHKDRSYSHHDFRKAFSLFIVFVFLCSVIPSGSFADEDLGGEASNPAVPGKQDMDLEDGIKRGPNDPHRVAEAADLNTENSTVYEMSNGSYEVVISQVPINYENDEGIFEPIDRTIEYNKKSGKYETKATKENISFSGAEDGFRLSISGNTCGKDEKKPLEYEISMFPTSLAVPSNAEEHPDGDKEKEGDPIPSENRATAIPEDNKILYPNVATETSLGYEVMPSGIKETLILESKDAPTQYSFEIKSKGLEAKEVNANSQEIIDEEMVGKNEGNEEAKTREEFKAWAFVNPETNEVIFELGDLIIYDSSQNGAMEPVYCDEKEVIIDPKEDGLKITYRFSDEWLNDSDRVFPIFVDPTINSPTDIYISSKYSKTSYGSATELKAGYYDATTGYNRSLLKFDCSTTNIPKNAGISKATLRVYQFHTYFNNQATTAYLGLAKKSFTASSTWDSLGCSKADTSLFSAYQSKSYAGRGVWVEWNVASAVQNWVHGNATNYGFVFYQKEGTASQEPECWRKFNSAQASEKKPQLVVSYTNTPDSATSLSATPTYPKPGTYSFTVNWGNITPKANIRKIEYRVIKGVTSATGHTQNGGTTVKDWTTLKSVSDGAAGSTNISLTVAEGCYAIAVRGIDLNGAVGTSKVTWVHVDGTAPPQATMAATPVTPVTNATPGNYGGIPKISWNSAADAANPVCSVKAVSIQTYIKRPDGTNTGLVQVNSLTANPSVGSYTFPAGAFMQNDSRGHTLVLRVTDRAGNFSERTYPYYFDSIKPTPGTLSVTVNSSTQDNYGRKWTMDTNPQINFNNFIENQSKIVASGVQYAIEKQGEAASAFKAPNLSGTVISQGSPYTPYTGSFRLAASDLGIKSGIYKIYARATDTAGNMSGNTQPTLYCKDVDAPKGKFVVQTSLSGMASIEIHISDEAGQEAINPNKSTLKLYKDDGSGIVSSGSIMVSKGLIADSFTEPVTFKYDFDTRNYPNDKYIMKMDAEDYVGLKFTTSKAVTISNTLNMPMFEPGKVSSTGAVTVSWGTNEPAELINRTEYQVSGTGVWLSAAGIGVTNGSFTAQLTPPGIENYYMKLRHVGTDGQPGEARDVHLLWDSTPPIAVISGFTGGYLYGTITDKYLTSWKVEYKAQGESDSCYQQIFTGTREILNDRLCFIDLSVPQYQAGMTYVFRLIACDAGDNIASSQFNITKQVEETDACLSVGDFHIKRPDSQVGMGPVFTLPTSTTQLELQADEEKSLPSDIEWYIDGMWAGSGEIYEDDFSTLPRGNSAPKYIQNTPYNVFAVGYDEEGMPIFSSNIIKNADVFDLSGWDTEDSCELVEFEKQAASFRIDVEYPEELDYFNVSFDSDTIEIDPGETINFFDEWGFPLSDYMYVNFASFSGDPDDLGEIKVYIDALDEEYFMLSELEKYTPTNLGGKQKLNFKSYIIWSSKIDESTPPDISYRVYRDIYAGFIPSDDNLIADDIKAGYFTEPNAGYKGKLYYKVCAVKKDASGYVTARSSYSNETDISVIDENEFSKRMGMKEYWQYQNFGLPIGTGYVEKSRGNFFYKQTDVSLPNEGVPIDFSRIYNSQASYKTSFGRGWSHAYDIELVNDCKNSADQLDYKNMLLRDATGSMFGFLLTDYGEYASQVGKYISLAHEPTSTAVEVSDRTPGTYSTNPTKMAIVNSEFTVRTMDKNEYRFNSGGQLVYQTEPNGNFLLFEYDPDTGLLYKVSSSKNSLMQFDYNNDNEGDVQLVKSVLLPDGSKLKYEYQCDSSIFASDDDEKYRLGSVVRESKSGSESITYDLAYEAYGGILGISNGVKRLSSIFDGEGNEYGIKYYPENYGLKVKSISYPEDSYNEETCFTYLTEAGINNPLDKTIIQRKIQNGVTNTIFGEDESYFKQGFGSCVKYIDAEGSVTDYSYRDNLLEVTTTRAIYQTYNTSSGIVQSHTKEKAEVTGYDPETDAPIIVFDENGGIVAYSYGSNASWAQSGLPLTEIETDGNGDVTSYLINLYDAKGNLVKTVDSVTGEVTGTEYDDDGEEEEEEELMLVDGTEVPISQTSYEYTYSPADGSKTVNTIETCGTSVITTTSIYDCMGNEISNTDSLGKETTNSYDGLGRHTGTTTSYGGRVQSTQTKYDYNGSVTSETDENDVTTSYSYDSRNRPLSTQVSKDSESMMTQTSYSFGQISPLGGLSQNQINATIITETDVGGYETLKSYTDTMGRTVRDISGGIYTDYTYSTDGNMLASCQVSTDSSIGLMALSLVDSKGNKTHNILNPEIAGGAYKTTEDSIMTISEYDEAGKNTANIDGLGNNTKFNYDNQGRLVSIITPDGGTQRYNYMDSDSSGNSSITTTDAKGNESVSLTNVRGLTTDIIDKGNKSVSPIHSKFIFDNTKDLVKTELDSNGNKKEFIYDSMDRLISTKYYEKHGSAEIFTMQTDLEYDDSDNVSEIRDYTTDGGLLVLKRFTEYSYDYINRLTGFSEVMGPDEPTNQDIENSMTTYSYSLDGSLKRIDYPQSANSKIDSLVFFYDPIFRTISSVVADSGGDIKTIRKYEHDKFGRAISVNDYRDFMDDGPASIEKTISYDIFGRVTGIRYTDSEEQGAPKESYSYSYSKNNDIISESISNCYLPEFEGKIDIIKEYGYDSMGRLENTAITDNTSSVSSITSYSFDSLGNTLSEISDYGDTEYTYNSLNQLVSKTVTDESGTVSDCIFSYDTAGNQIAMTDSAIDQVTKMTYDAANRLKNYQIIDGGDVQYEQENEYNGEGQRIRKIEVGAEITDYYYQGSSVFYTTDDNGYVSTLSIMAGEGNLIATERPKSKNQRDYYFYNKDIRGSTTNLIDSGGECVVGYEYDDYGQTIIRYPEAAEEDEKLNNEICYTGSIYDEETQLYYLNARYYDPAKKGMLSQDSYRGTQTDPSTWNLYAYCANNPINRIDPTGHDAIWLNSPNGAAGLGHAALLVESGSKWAIFSWEKRGYKTSTLGNNWAKYVDKKNKKVLKGINSNRPRGKPYKKSIYIKGNFIDSYNYISKIIAGNTSYKYWGPAQNCGWMSIEVLKQGSGLSKNQKDKLWSLQYYKASHRRGNRVITSTYRHIVIPNNTISKIKGITYGTENLIPS